MRKRIALFANGWSSEFLQKFGYGLRQAAALADVDVFAFINYTSHGDLPENRRGETNIFRLPDLKDFDGAIALANTFNDHAEVDLIRQLLVESDIPSISLEYKMDGIDFFGTDDYSGMCQLTEHLIKEHEVKDFMFIGGMKDHEGSNTRLQAVLDTATVYGITVPAENILYGNFAADPAVLELKKWCNNHEKMPDVIVCANDVMAIGICEWLKEQGYEIPNDIKVTGFDCLEAGQDYEPRLTSVSSEWVSMGTRVMEKLLKKIQGEEVDSYEEFSSTLVCGETCGCHDDEEYLAKKKGQYVSSLKKVDGFSCDQHFRHMYLSIRKAENTEALNESLTFFFVHEGWLEGKRVMLCLHPDFFYTDNLDSMKGDGYPEEIDIVCSVYDGQASPIKREKTKDAMFSIANRSKMPGIYIYVPVRLDDATIGFAMLTRGFSIVQNDILYLWTRHVNEYMEQVKSNVMIKQLTKRLEMLSVTDALTGVYNRTGCETIIYPKLELCQIQGGQCVVMIADVDRLKYINDTYGHSGGDQAIKMTAIALKDSLPEGFMIGRYGGDEFLVGGCVKESIDVGELTEKIAEQLEKEARKTGLSFKLTMSIGGVQLSKNQKFDIMECIQKADLQMYKIKEIHHSEQSDY